MGSRGDTGGQDGGGSRESNKKARQDTEVSAYEREIEKQKAKKTTTRKSTDDSRNTGRENKAVSNYTSLTKDDASQIKESKETVRKATGKSKLDNYEIPESEAPGTVGIFLNATRDVRQKMFEENREFFQEKVLTSKNRGKYEDTFDSYNQYMNDRLSGRSDAYGNPMIQTEGNDKTAKSVEQPKVKSQMDNTDVKSDLITADKTSPTSVEVNQEEDELKRKRRGRKNTILTSVYGDTSKPTLSKRTLLGG